MKKYCEYCCGVGQVGVVYDLHLCDECKGKGYTVENVVEMTKIEDLLRKVQRDVEEDIKAGLAPEEHSEWVLSTINSRLETIMNRILYEE